MSEQNIQIAKEIYAAFQRGDIASIMGHVSDDLEGFGIISERELIPWHVQISKKADVPKFFQAVSETAEFTRFEAPTLPLVATTSTAPAASTRCLGTIIRR